MPKRKKYEYLSDITIEHGQAKYTQPQQSEPSNDDSDIPPDAMVDPQYAHLSVLQCKEARVSLSHMIFSLFFCICWCVPIGSILCTTDIGHMSMTINGKYVEDAGIFGYVFMTPFILVAIISVLINIVPISTKWV